MLKSLFGGLNLLHIILKFTYSAWDQPDPDLKTMDEHMKMIESRGQTWWGRKSSMAEDKFESIKDQIESGNKTYAFLYCTKVPRSVHPDGVLWYLAKIENISPCKPNTIEFIPPHYRHKEFESAFMFKKIDPLHYDKGQTPKVPGQSTIRYVTLRGKQDPKNLFVHNQDIPICKNIAESGESNKSQTSASVNEDKPNEQERNDDRENLLMEIIELQREVMELKTYKDKYNKILQAESMFNSEKVFESWLKENIHHISKEIEILDQQPTITWPDGKFGRLDLLGKNKDTGNITIIEVKTKKRNKRSGYDQFVRYTSWVKRNMKKIHSKYSLESTSKDVDFVIITDHINDEMVAICEDNGISLIHVFGGLGFNKIVE